MSGGGSVMTDHGDRFIAGIETLYVAAVVVIVVVLIAAAIFAVVKALGVFLLYIALAVIAFCIVVYTVGYLRTDFKNDVVTLLK